MTKRAGADEGWPFWRVAGLFVLGWIVLASPWLSGRLTVPWDAKAHFQAQLQFLADSLHRGEAPFWNPFTFAGMPQIADPQSLIFSPPHLVLAAIVAEPSLREADVVAFVMLLLGGIGVIAFIRDRGWHPAGALVAALVFAFGASAAWRIQHTGQVLSYSYFPLALWALSRALERRSIGYGLLSGVLAGCMVLGRDQIAWLGVYLLAAFLLWHLLRQPGFGGRLRAALPALFAGVVGGIVVAGLPILMTLLLAGDSNRPAIDFIGAGRGSLHPASLLTAFVANLYGTDGPLADFWGQPSVTWGPTDLYLARNMSDVYVGAVPLLALLGAGVAGGALLARDVRYAALAFAAVSLYALGWYTPAFTLLFKLPGADLWRRPADATFYMGAFAGLLAGWCVHLLATRPAEEAWARRAMTGAAVLAIAGLLACIAVALWKGKFGQAVVPVAAASLILALSAAALRLAGRWGTSRPLAVAALLGAVLVGDLAWSNGPNESTALPPELYNVLQADSADPLMAFLRARVDASSGPDRRDRIELAGIDFHWPNASMVHRLDNTTGYNPIRLSLYARATGAEDHAALPEQRVFSPLFPGYHSRLSDLLGLRYIATRGELSVIDKAWTPQILPEVGRFPVGRVYENPGALPRVLFATQAQPADFEALTATGAWPDVDPRRTVLLETAAPAGGPAGRGLATLRRYRNTEVVVHASSDVPGWIVLNDVWHPWWRASLDGQPAELLRANVIFRAVAVPAGEHEVCFTFEPLAGTAAELAMRLGLAK